MVVVICSRYLRNSLMQRETRRLKGSVRVLALKLKPRRKDRFIEFIYTEKVDVGIVVRVLRELEIR